MRDERRPGQSARRCARGGPPGPRPKRAALYPRQVWLVEAIVFAVGIEALVNGVPSGSEALTLLAGLLLVGAAAAGCVGAALTVVVGRRALRPHLPAAYA
jgi:hypothetical protein